MDAKLLAAAAASLAAGIGLGWAAGRRRRTAMRSALADEERLAWLQRLSTIGQMMSGVVHEVRTPLNTVILTVEHAQSVLARGGDPKEQLAAASREADRAVEILSDILDFAKPSPLELQPLDLRFILAGALEALKLRFSERGVALSLFAPPGLIVRASERHLHQVLTIILINALDALHFGGRLDIRAEAADGEVRVALRDTGVGIDAPGLARLFQPFATGRAESGGTGLGLNVARWIMHKHGGDIAITSPGVGKGTTVELVLPKA